MKLIDWTSMGCKKCGHASTIVRWLNYTYGPYSDKMEITCNTCGYTWYEDTMDSRLKKEDKTDDSE